MRQFKVRLSKYGNDPERPYEIVYVNPAAFDTVFVVMSKEELAELAKQIINVISES